jgi:A/G-specific adenine glycosylase
VAPRVPRAPRERFEQSDRWARGRVVASLAAGEGLPAGIAGERLARVLAALERDGHVERRESGVGLPRRGR